MSQALAMSKERHIHFSGNPAPKVTLQRRSLGSADTDYVGNLVQPMLKGTVFSLRCVVQAKSITNINFLREQKRRNRTSHFGGVFIF